MERNQRVTYAGNNLHNLSISYVSDGISKKWGMEHRKYKVTLETDFGKVTFTYHDSRANYTIGKTKLNLYDLHNALDCFLDDCFAHINDEFGYSGGISNKEMARIKQGCKKQYERLLVLVGGDPNDINDFVNAINKVIFDR